MRAPRWVATVAATLVAAVVFAPATPAAAGSTVQLATPANFHVASNTAEAITLAWNPVSGNGIYYEVYRDNQTYPAWVPEATYKIERSDGWGLEPGTTHTFRVRAGASSGGVSEFASLTVTWAPGDVTPPTAPANLRVVKQDASGAQLAWDPSTDDSGRVLYTIVFPDADGTGLSFNLGAEPSTFVNAGNSWIGTVPGSSVRVFVYANDFTGQNPSGTSNILTVRF